MFFNHLNLPKLEDGYFFDSYRLLSLTLKLRKQSLVTTTQKLTRLFLSRDKTVMNHKASPLLQEISHHLFTSLFYKESIT